MKIDDLIFLPIKPSSSPEPKAGKDNFAQFLNEAVALREKEGAPSALSGPSPVAGAASGDPVRAVRDMVETVLSRLEIFQEGLSRPGLTLKALSPLLQALEQDSQRLTSLSQSLPEDSPLRRLVDEAAALTWTESYKFKRGDYF
jgi:hypothetical protein